MKPIAIIAIIAAIVVVGGACAGVAFSGVLNGGTTGPGGEGVTDPNGPTDPTGPIDPPLPPTDTPMSTFSPMTSSGSSSSSQPSTEPTEPTVTPNVCPSCQKEDWEDYEINEDADTHKKVCKFCDYEEAEEDCNFGGLTHAEESGLHSHSQTCSVCTNVDKKYCFSAEFKPNEDSGEKTHSKFCDTCSAEIETGNCQSTVGFVSNDDQATHSKFCDDCGQVTETGNCDGSYARNPGSTTHSKICDVCTQVLETGDCAQEEPTSTNDGYHTFNCEMCGDAEGSAKVACTYEYTAGSAGYHSKKCTDCGYTAGTDTTAEQCTLARHVYTNDGKHTVMCEYCEYSSASEECTITNISNGDGSGSHKEVCSVCEGVVNDAVSCTFGTYENVAAGVHKVKCDYCGGVQGALVECTNVAYDSIGEDTHKVTCNDCNTVKTESEPCTFGEYEYNDDSAEPLNIKKCKYCTNEDKQLVVATISVGGKTVGYLNVSEAVADAGVGEVTLVRDMDGATIVAEDIAEGATATINPSGKKTLLTYENITDIQIKDGLGADSKVNVTGSVEGAAELVVSFNATAKDGMLVVDYALSDTEMYICTVAGFLEFANMANTDTDKLAGWTVKLMADIDLTGQAWTSINSFAGTFDGQGHTISNMTERLFTIITGTLKNLKVANVNVAYTTNLDGGSAIARYMSGTVENCEFSNIKVSTTARGKCMAGIFSEVNGKVTGCTVNGLSVIAQGSSAKIDSGAGGFAGIVKGGSEITDCTLNDVVVTADYANNAGGIFGKVGQENNADITLKNITVNGLTMKVGSTAVTTTTIANVGGFIGQCDYRTNDSRLTIDNCHINDLDMTITSNKNGEDPTAGFISSLNGGADITNCSVDGKINGTQEPLGVGGFLGTVGGHNAKNAYVINITDCIAAVDITGNDSNYVGGFVAYSGSRNKTITLTLNFTNCEAKDSFYGVLETGTNEVSVFTNCKVDGAAFDGTQNN